MTWEIGESISKKGYDRIVVGIINPIYQDREFRTLGTTSGLFSGALSIHRWSFKSVKNVNFEKGRRPVKVVLPSRDTGSIGFVELQSELQI